MSYDRNICFDPCVLRNQLGMNQSAFWNPIGVTQSGGSRYEKDRRIPATVMELLRLRYLLGINLDGVTAENAPLIRSIANGDVDTGTLHLKVGRIRKVLLACENVGTQAAHLARAAEALLD